MGRNKSPQPSSPHMWQVPLAGELRTQVWSCGKVAPVSSCHYGWEDVLVSTVWKVLGIWVSPAGHPISCCDPQATMGRSHRVFALYKVTATVCLSTTMAGPRLDLADTLSVVPPLSTDHGSWVAKVPECL